MNISLEISYYPLCQEYRPVVKAFIGLLEQTELRVEPGNMSTVITGDYASVMHELTGSMREFLEKYPSVFTLKISNACPV